MIFIIVLVLIVGIVIYKLTEKKTPVVNSESIEQSPKIEENLGDEASVIIPTEVTPKTKRKYNKKVNAKTN